MPITGALNGNITMTDNLSGSVQLTKALVFQYLGTIFEYSQAQSIGTSPTSLSLPLSPAQFLYIKNLSTTATVAVTWTPTGGSTGSVLTLQPGATIIYVETNTTSGITALSVTASALATPIEYILLG
jgi:hypothetical protein